MTTLQARPYKGLLKRFWLEVTITATVGFIVFMSGLITLFTTNFEIKAAVIPMALGLIGLGYAVFGLICVKNYKKGWEQNQTVITFDDQGVTFDGLPKIKWDNIALAVSTGKYSKHGLDLGFSVAALRRGKQFQIHSPVSKIVKLDKRSKLTSTYFGFIVENTTNNFGEYWELGTVVNTKNDKSINASNIFINPDLFLTQNDYDTFLKTFAYYMAKKNTVHLETTHGMAFALIITSWNSYHLQEVACNSKGLSKKGKEFVTWFNSLSKEKTEEIINTIYVNEQQNPDVFKKRTDAVEAVAQQITTVTKETLFIDNFYAGIITLHIADMAVTMDKDNKLASTAASAFEAYGIAIVAETNNVNVPEMYMKHLKGAIEKVGFVSNQPENLPLLPPLPPLPNSQ